MVRSYKGRFQPKNISKYKGDPTKIIYRSLLERRYMVAFDEDPNIVAWNSEEVVVPYVSPVDGNAHRYFVDFMITVKNRAGNTQTYLIEIKPSSQTQPPKKPKKPTPKFLTEQLTWVVNNTKWEAAKKYAETRGWKFLVFTEKTIGNGI